MDAHQVVNMLLFEQTFMCNVEWNQRNGNTRMEHNMRGMRVHKNMDLRQWTHISRFLNGTAHDHQFLDGFCEPRLLADCHRDICQRRDGEDADLVGFCQYSLDQIIHSMLRYGFVFRLR